PQPSRPRLYLALDTSTNIGSVAIGNGADILAEAVIGSRASEALVPAIDFVLQRAGVARTQLDGIVVAGGPGSFTGVRIAAATAKGFVHALHIPLFAYSGLMSVAANAA